MLYRDNTFSFPDPTSMIFFSQTVLPQRLKLVRLVHLLWNYDPSGSIKKSEQKDLLKVHKVLKKMKGLKIISFISLFVWPFELLDLIVHGPIGQDTRRYSVVWTPSEG